VRALVDLLHLLHPRQVRLISHAPTSPSESTIAWTRDERRAEFHLGLLQLACALICHRQLARPF
jgi:hypothetical protein